MPSMGDGLEAVLLKQRDMTNSNLVQEICLDSSCPCALQPCQKTIGDLKTDI